MPLELSTVIETTDAVYTFCEVIDHIDLNRYIVKERSNTGRPKYDAITLLKVILFAFMENGYASTREIEKYCKTDIRYMWLLQDRKAPSHMTIDNFMNESLAENIQDIFKKISSYIVKVENVDLNHTYIDGTKIVANANKYSWVWRKGTEKSRYKLFGKVTALLTEINEEIACTGIHIETATEYTPEQLQELAERYAALVGIDHTQFKHGRGHHKSVQQRHYEKLVIHAKKLGEYVEKLRICGRERNSYSKTDHDATFMRMKCDYMGNDQLLPGYNIQIAVADEYIAAVDVKQYRSDMDCFIPLMERFKTLYGFYPRYPIADAGYGSYNNYIFCQEHGMEKYMKFPMYKKETEDEKYRNDPFRAVNFKTDSAGNLVCPNGKTFRFAYRQPVKGNLYGRQEEVYECEDCSGCPYAGQCKKADRNRTIRLNRELTSMHREVLENLESVHGALLRMNRSIQAEGTFGILKQDRNYKRIVRRGLDFVKLELYLVSIGHNLYKFYNKSLRSQAAA